MRKLSILFAILAAACASFAQDGTKPAVPQSEAAKAFAKLGTLSGSWQGSIMNIPISGTMRPASSGTVIVHEWTTADGPPDDEMTMFYLEGDRLIATHYCDAGNRARFEGKMSPDGKSIDFTFLDVVGSEKGGLVKHIKFTLTEPNKQLVEMTFVMPGGKALELKGEFRRTKKGKAI
jgi:hypothetical protein